MIENWFWHDKCLLVSVISQCLCSVSCTSPILGAIKYLLSPCSLHSGGNKSFGAPPLISWAQPFFFSWMDCVADGNQGNLYFCVKYSGFMMQTKVLAVLCGILKFFLEFYLILLGGGEGPFSSPSRCWIFLRVCAANTTFTLKSWVDGIQWFLKDGKNILTARWDLEYFLAVDLERLGWVVRKKAECFSCSEGLTLVASNLLLLICWRLCNLSSMQMLNKRILL